MLVLRRVKGIQRSEVQKENRPKTWIDILEDTARKFSDTEALAFGDQRIT
jgi:hypothetical protein